MQGKATSRKERVVVLSDLDQDKKKRFYQFLVANDVEFVMRNDGHYMAHIRVVPPKTDTTAQHDALMKGSVKEGVVRGGAAGVKTSQDDKSSTKPPAIQTQRLLHTLSQRYSAFCELIQTIEHMPRPRPVSELTRIIDEIYDARFARDTTRIRMESNGEIVELERQDERFPCFVLQHFMKLHGLKRMVNQTSWGLVVSIDRWRKSSPAISLFALFFDESLSVKELLFFLFARNVVETELSIPRQRNYQNQYWLTTGQQTTCLNEIFAKRTQLIDRVQDLLTSNVSMSFFLLTMTLEYHRMRTGVEVSAIQDEECGKIDKDVEGVKKRLYEVVGPDTPIDANQVASWAECLVRHKQELNKMAETWDTMHVPGDQIAPKTGPIRFDGVERELREVASRAPVEHDVDAKELEQMKMISAERFCSNLEPNIRTILRLKVNIMIKNLAPHTPKDVRLEVARKFATIVDNLVNATVTHRHDLWCKELETTSIEEPKNFLLIQERLNYYVAKQTSASQIDTFLNEILVLPEVEQRAEQLLQKTTEKYEDLAKAHQLYVESIRVRQYGTE